MNKSFAILFLSLLVISCNSTSSAPATDGSYLIAQPDTLVIHKSDSAKAIKLKLSCGCPFTLKVIAVNGDTTVIKYNAVERLSDTLTSHSINFSVPSSANISDSSIYSITFLAQKHSYTYNGTVWVKAFK